MSRPLFRLQGPTKCPAGWTKEDPHGFRPAKVKRKFRIVLERRKYFLWFGVRVSLTQTFLLPQKSWKMVAQDLKVLLQMLLVWKSIHHPSTHQWNTGAKTEAFGYTRSQQYVMCAQNEDLRKVPENQRVVFLSSFLLVFNHIFLIF